MTWNAVDRAERRDVLDLTAIDAMLKRRRDHRGAARLRKALAIHREPGFFRARSERLFRRLVKKAGLRPPLLNTFAVEIDGWEAHRTRRAFEHDRLRQEEMKLAGIDMIRLSARRIETEPAAVSRRLKLLLQRRRRELGLG